MLNACTKFVERKHVLHDSLDSRLRAQHDFEKYCEPHKRKQRLLSCLRGQTISVPDLAPLFWHWPTKINPALNRLRREVGDWLRSTIPPGRVLNTLLASDFGLFGATWWPCANYDKLQIATYLAVWLFIWDDEIDTSDGTMWNRFDAAEIYRNQTLAYVGHCLGIVSDEECPEISYQIILNFAPIGTAIKQTCTLAQRQRMYQDMQLFMDKSGQEQQLRLSGKIPSVEDFWHCRLGSSAVYVCIAMNEFSWEDMDLPAEFRDDDDVKSICKHTNTIVSATNDLLSLKKEVDRDGIESLVPILFFHLGDMERAVAEVVAFIGTEIAKMDVAAAALSSRYKSADDDIRQQVENFVLGCKHYATGNLTWSLTTDRYGVEKAGDEIIMQL